MDENQIDQILGVIKTGNHNINVSKEIDKNTVIGQGLLEMIMEKRYKEGTEIVKQGWRDEGVSEEDIENYTVGGYWFLKKQKTGKIIAFMSTCHNDISSLDVIRKIRSAVGHNYKLYILPV